MISQLADCKTTLVIEPCLGHSVSSHGRFPLDLNTKGETHRTRQDISGTATACHLVGEVCSIQNWLLKAQAALQHWLLGFSDGVLGSKMRGNSVSKRSRSPFQGSRRAKESGTKDPSMKWLSGLLQPVYMPLSISFWFLSLVLASITSDTEMFYLRVQLLLLSTMFPGLSFMENGRFPFLASSLPTRSPMDTRPFPEPQSLLISIELYWGFCYSYWWIMRR